MTGSARRRSRRRTAGGGGAGWRHRGCLKRVMPPNPRTRKYRPGATAPRACRLRVGIPVKWARAEARGYITPENGAPSAGLPRADHARAALRAARVPIRTPAARRRTRRGARRDGPSALGRREARYGKATPRTSASREHPEAHLRHARAGARRHPGDGAARRRFRWPPERAATAHWTA